MYTSSFLPPFKEAPSSYFFGAAGGAHCISVPQYLHRSRTGIKQRDVVTKSPAEAGQRKKGIPEPEQTKGKKESRGSVLAAAKDDLLSEISPLCGSQTGKLVHDSHFG